MGTSEKRPDLAMGRRPIDISEESALVPIEEVRLLFSLRKPTNSYYTIAVLATHAIRSARCALNAWVTIASHANTTTQARSYHL
jgi:hypothetical protein